MTCPKCHKPSAQRGPVIVAPFSGAIERLDSCPCGWWILIFLGWIGEQTVQLEMEI